MQAIDRKIISNFCPPMQSNSILLNTSHIESPLIFLIPLSTDGRDCINHGRAVAKPKRRTVPRVASDVMTSCRARRMSERRLESEDIDPSLYRVRGMAVPQLVWVNVKTGGSSPLSPNISNRLSSEMSLSDVLREHPYVCDSCVAISWRNTISVVAEEPVTPLLSLLFGGDCHGYRCL